MVRRNLLDVFSRFTRLRRQLCQHPPDLRLWLPGWHTRVEGASHALFSFAVSIVTFIISATRSSMSCEPLHFGAYAEIGIPSPDACANCVHWRISVGDRNSG